ncbi:MAG: hypothetical protein DRN35_06125 [Thermoplasmata archaeon]|nr:MAG: hypothetical protein DRN35_06125 [Thermoplasmata archaeon]
MGRKGDDSLFFLILVILFLIGVLMMLFTLGDVKVEINFSFPIWFKVGFALSFISGVLLIIREKGVKFFI